MPDDPELQRWRGRVDAFMDESTRERQGARDELAKLTAIVAEHHRELLTAIQKMNDRVSDETSIRKQWEARAQGVSWLLHMLSATVGAVVAWGISLFKHG